MFLLVNLDRFVAKVIIINQYHLVMGSLKNYTHSHIINNKANIRTLSIRYEFELYTSDPTSSETI